MLKEGSRPGCVASADSTAQKAAVGVRACASALPPARSSRTDLAAHTIRDDSWRGPRHQARDASRPAFDCLFSRAGFSKRVRTVAPAASWEASWRLGLGHRRAHGSVVCGPTSRGRRRGPPSSQRPYATRSQLQVPWRVAGPTTSLTWIWRRRSWSLTSDCAQLARGSDDPRTASPGSGSLVNRPTPDEAPARRSRWSIRGLDLSRASITRTAATTMHAGLTVQRQLPRPHLAPIQS
jgi:hypothetical protein